jgi:uncharacterized membrane protein
MKPNESDNSVFILEGAGQRSWSDKIVRPFREFMGIPFSILLIFTIIGVIIYILERQDPSWVQTARDVVSSHMFGTPGGTMNFLGFIGGALISLTSLTVTILLLMLQQMAANMGNLIYDQFLSHKYNQFFLGYLLGVTFLSLFNHAITRDDFNPILGATMVFLTTIVLLILFIFFLYSTMDQMRASTIVETIAQESLTARQHHLDLLARTRREPQISDGEKIIVRSGTEGHFIRIDIPKIQECLAQVDDSVEILLLIELGATVIYYDPVAEIRAANRDQAHKMAVCLGKALRFGTRRNARTDAAYGLKQLETIGWTNSSQAKHNPDIGQKVAYALQSLLRRWMLQDSSEPDRDEKVLPVVYVDRVPTKVIDAFESLIVISQESFQHQILSTIYNTLAQTLPHLTPELQERAQELVVRTLPTLQRHTLTRDLDMAVIRLRDALQESGAEEVARAVQQAREERARQSALPLKPPQSRETDPDR